MDGDEGPSGDGIGKLSQRLSERAVVPGGEVDYKTKAGTAWSHSFLNQKPWHPLSYPNQRRKWIAEQTHANRDRRAEEVAREFAQEQEFFRQTALFSKKEKEKVEMLKAVSFMYVRPPGYNAESAKAAEVADEKKRLDQNIAAEDGTNEATPAMPEVRLDSGTHRDKKARPKDVFGRALPTEEEFEVLKNAPRIDTGVAGRVKPFAVEIRNVRCVRCGAFGHQSGDRECPLKDAIMPNEESRLKRDDPLTAMMAQTDSSEPLKWELKQKPGMSPPRGGYQADDPNQQIVADDTIFDEYGGFLSGGDIPALLSNFTRSKPKKRSKHKSKHKDHHKSKVRHMNQSLSSESEDDREMNRKHKGRHNSRVRHRSRSQSSSSESEDESEMNLKHKDHHKSMVRHKNQSSSSESGDDMEMNRRSRSKHKKKSSAFEEDREMNPRSRSKHKSFKSEDDVEMMNWRSRSKHKKNSESECDVEINRRSRSKHRKTNQSSSSESEDDGEKYQRSRSKHKRYNSSSSELEDDREKNKKRSRSKHREQKKQRHVESSAPDSYDSYHHRHHQRRRHSESIAPDSSDSHHHRHRREHGYHSDSTPYSSGSPHHPRRNQH